MAQRDFENHLTQTATEHDPEQERRNIGVALCADSQECLHDLSAHFGVTMAALLDAMGHIYGPVIELDLPDLEEVAPLFATSIRLARQIDAQRRFRH